MVVERGVDSGPLDRKAVCDALRTVRLCAGFSQQELAERAGVAQNKISRWERIAPPSLESLLVLERALGVSPGRVLRVAGMINIDVIDWEAEVLRNKRWSSQSRHLVIAAVRAADSFADQLAFVDRSQFRAS